MDTPVGGKGQTTDSEGDIDTPTPNPEIMQPSEKQDQESANKPTAYSTPPQPSQLIPAQEMIETTDAINDSIPDISAVPPAPLTSSAPSSSIGENSLLDSPLMGKVFVMDIHEVGDMSLHFDKEIGCYLSCEHSDFSSKTFDDGVAWPTCRRFICTDQSYNLEERKFCGLAQFGGTWNGNVAIKYEMKFDT